MATNLDKDYVLLNGAAYGISAISGKNQLPIPEGWTRYELPTEYDSGLNVTTFQNGNHFVIAFPGTENNFLSIDGLANTALALGLWSNELFHAAWHYLELKTNNRDADITFVGHSLGGGLASLLAVFFNEEATTFGQAPFRALHILGCLFITFFCWDSLANTNPVPVFELQDIGIKQKPNYFITIYPDGKVHYQGFNSFVNDDRYAQITHEQLDAFTIYFFSLPFAASKKYEIKRGFERWHRTIDYKGTYSRVYIDDPIFFYVLIKKLDALIHLQQWICFPINHPDYNDHCMGGDIPTNLDDLKSYYQP